MTYLAEWITMGIVVVAAAAFVSYLVYLKATALGHSPAHIRRGLSRVWLCLLAAVVVLAGARAIVGGPIISYSPFQGGLRLDLEQPAGTYITICAIALVGILAYVALHNIRQLQHPPDLTANKAPTDNRSQDSQR